MIIKEPFIVETDSGRYLVLRCVQLCNVKTVKCTSATASCVLKVDKPESPPCARRATPPGSPTRAEQQQVPFMNTNMLASMFASNKQSAAKLIA
ncbi:virion core DNA-binding phosphoprotein [Equine molluscum contagiosum-like virus]|nr:virion core DNA-binding phosphoprotein [Equine molluscum contagiosum-like virus]